jgi:hypothetical protein
MALTLKVAFVIHTDLAAGIWVFALIYICGEEHRSELAGLLGTVTNACNPSYLGDEAQEDQGLR